MQSIKVSVLRVKNSSLKAIGYEKVISMPKWTITRQKKTDKWLWLREVSWTADKAECKPIHVFKDTINLHKSYK